MLEAWGLVLASLLMALAWLPASVAKKETFGVRWLASNRETEGLPPLQPWGERAVRAHNNLKENFPAWAALLLLIIALDWQNTVTAWAALLFP
ncbi:MAPEG family protein, partial [Natronospira sp.]